MKTIYSGILALLLFASPAFAQTGDEARDLAERGVVAFDSQDYTTAEQNLGKAYAVLKAPTIALFRARALVKLGRWVEASALYEEAAGLEIETGNRETQEAAQQERYASARRYSRAFLGSS